MSGTGRAAGRALLLAAWMALSCARTSAPEREDGARCGSLTYATLEESRPRYQAAVVAVQGWLDRLDVDPIALRRHGIKGKKKLTEQLDGYYRLWQIADPEERAGLLSRIAEVVAITYTPRFHDMAALSDKHFKQDATSYLRAALLMDRLGLDTSLYREEIRKVHPRLNAHMDQRGPHQRLAFHWYYKHFGLEEPFSLADSLRDGLIAARADPASFTDMDAYHLTHEVFIPYEYGERLDSDPFTAEDKAYLERALTLLVARYIERKDPDLLAELISCLRYLRMVELPSYREGLAWLLGNQHPDGSWGDLERARKGFGDYGAYGRILHSSMVALDALTIAYHEPWNRDLYPGCAGAGQRAAGG